MGDVKKRCCDWCGKPLPARRHLRRIELKGLLLVEDMIEEAVGEGVTPAIAKAAIERLEEMEQIGKIGWDRIVPAASIPTVEKTAAPGRGEY